MDGHSYLNLIAQYIKKNYSIRGIKAYKEISVGKTIIGKNRRIDLLLVDEEQKSAFAIEYKYQNVHGTADEKIPYTLEDVRSFPMKGCVAYAGNGFSKGVLHLLEAHPLAVYCSPDELLQPSHQTKELDHILAMCFNWWDILTDGKQEV